MSANNTINSPSDLAQYDFAPYDFGRAIFLPFHSGSRSFVFVMKSALFYAVGLFILYMLFGEMMNAANVTYQEKTVADPLNATRGRALMILKSLPLYLGMWMLWVSVETAFHRRVLLGQTNNPFPWRFGGDELRVMLCQLMVMLVFFVVFYVLFFVLVFAVGVLGSFLGPIFIGIMAFIGFFVALFVASFLTIRLAPAAARPVLEQRLAIVETWAVTKGRFWPRLGAYYLLWIVGMVIYFVLTILVMGAVYGDAFMEYMKVSMSGDAAANLEMTKELYEGEGANLRAGTLSAVLGIFLAVLGLCITGIATHLNVLYDRDQGMSGVDVFD